MSGALQTSILGDTASLEALSDTASLEALSEDWWNLWSRCGASPFQSPAWLIPWWRHFHPGRLATIAAYLNGRLVGLAPFYLEDGGLGRRLLPLGISVSDYLDILLDPDFSDLAARGLGAAAMRMKIPWERWELEELSPEAAARSLPSPQGCREEAAEQSVCPVLVLPASTDELPSRAPTSMRRNLTLAKNRAGRVGGIEFKAIRSNPIPDFFESLARLHSARWIGRGEGGVFADCRVLAFHKEAAPLLERAGLARFYLAVLQGEPVAALYALRHNDRLLYYLSGFDPLRSFESPGALLLAHVIEDAQRQGLREFHFLRGRELYKDAWNPEVRVNLKRSFVRMPHG